MLPELQQSSAHLTFPALKYQTETPRHSFGLVLIRSHSDLAHPGEKWEPKVVLCCYGSSNSVSDGSFGNPVIDSYYF